jgi:hypothetical protein
MEAAARPGASRQQQQQQQQQQYRVRSSEVLYSAECCSAAREVVVLVPMDRLRKLCSARHAAMTAAASNMLTSPAGSVGQLGLLLLVYTAGCIAKAAAKLQLCSIMPA